MKRKLILESKDEQPWFTPRPGTSNDTSCEEAIDAAYGDGTHRPEESVEVYRERLRRNSGSGTPPFPNLGSNNAL